MTQNADAVVAMWCIPWGGSWQSCSLQIHIADLVFQNLHSGLYKHGFTRFAWGQCSRKAAYTRIAPSSADELIPEGAGEFSFSLLYGRSLFSSIPSCFAGGSASLACFGLLRIHCAGYLHGAKSLSALACLYRQGLVSLAWKRLQNGACASYESITWSR